MTFIGNDSRGIRHILIIEDSQGRRTITLEESKYSLGRQLDNDIVIQSKQASRKHATLVRKTNSQFNRFSYWILDGDLEGNKSHNGIFINGNKCLIYELKDGDLINFGCEVNASYHLLSAANSGETYLNLNSQQDREQAPIPNIQRRSTLILSDAYVSQGNDDTLQDKAYIDPLTKLPNRSLFNEHLSTAMGNAKRRQKPLALIFFDIENLKLINDQFSHNIGDLILQKFGEILKSCLRSADIVARWGGDEFVVLLPQINSGEDIPKICQRILKNFQNPLKIEDSEILLPLNFGLASYPQDGNESTVLLNKAEHDLGQYKLQKQKNTKIQQAKNSAKQTKLSKVENLLHQALNKSQFSLCYQPEVNIKTGEIVGLEALLRWHHPQYGSIAPNQFFPWIEKTDMIAPISEWILKQVSKQNLAWQQSGLNVVPISINFSSQQLQQSTLFEMLTKIFLETEINPNLIIIEITEESLLENTEESFRILHELKRLGIKIALDDFGSGYTSVSHLQQFSFCQLKIAQSLIQSLKHNPEDTKMISAVIALGQTFDIDVVAEGVENQQQMEILARLKCELMQGYRFSQPLTSQDATKFLSLHSTISFPNTRDK